MENTKNIDITTYLKHVANLEVSVYRQEKAIEQANERLNLYKEIEGPKWTSIPEPINRAKSMYRPVRPTPDDDELFQRKFNKFLLPFSAFGFAFCTLLYLSAGDDFYLYVMLITGGSFLMSLGFALFFFLRNKKREQEYMVALQRYEESVKREEAIYEKAMTAYYMKKTAANESYDREYAATEKRLARARKAISQMNKPFAETKDALRKLYSADVIFPKYRNMVAVCTIYEYFVTGRCTELTGTNGAYNLYESERRQDLIISRLDKIISQLEDIKDNQYILYQEITSTNRILEDISYDIGRILNSTAKIAKASSITAFCTQIIAQNTEALAYLSAIKE